MTPIKIAAEGMQRWAGGSLGPMSATELSTLAVDAIETAGFKILAPEPTEEMYQGGKASNGTLGDIWKYMHAAAPRWSKT